MRTLELPDWMSEGFVSPTLEEHDVADRGVPLSLDCHFDGLCEPRNPGGVATVAFATFDGFDDSPWRNFRAVLADGGPRATNNQAEWSALGALLRYLQGVVEPHRRRRKIAIYGDSLLVISQLVGTWETKAEPLRRLRNRCRKLVRSLESANCRVDVRHVRRQENAAADALSEQAFLEYAQAKDPNLVRRFRQGQAARGKARRKSEVPDV